MLSDEILLRQQAVAGTSLTHSISAWRAIAESSSRMGRVALCRQHMLADEYNAPVQILHGPSVIGRREESPGESQDYADDMFHAGEPREASPQGLPPFVISGRGSRRTWL